MKQKVQLPLVLYSLYHLHFVSNTDNKNNILSIYLASLIHESFINCYRCHCRREENIKMCVFHFICFEKENDHFHGLEGFLGTFQFV